ncbi:Purine nucleoside phosphorylase [Marasmius tenuissimus]|nr:Purine nucleoside phosphorylase [Marasmius tenuissimus]
MSTESSAYPFAQTIESLKRAIPQALQSPLVGIICGSGLSGLGSTLKDIVLVPYDTIPGFAQSTVPGHKSSLAFGFMGDSSVPVVAMLGRFHPYEGHELSSVTYPVRVMARLGVKYMIITNAAGALNPRLAVGTVVVVQDHLALPNLTGLNPLLGPQVSLDHPRFLPVSDAYSVTLRRLAFIASHQLSIDQSALAEGVYAWVSGPTYESPAEGRFLRAAGADVVGMSTVPEVVVAREEGMEVMVLSLVTNAVVIPETYRSIKDEVIAELAGQKVEAPPAEVVSHDEVLTLGREKGDMMKSLVERVVQLLPRSEK